MTGRRGILLAVAFCFSVQMSQSASTIGAEGHGPCYDELNQVKNTDAFQPQCTPDGYYEAKQCNSSEDCVCVEQCGDTVPGTHGDSNIRCEEGPAPCLKQSTNSGIRLFGQFRPRCRPDGFYYHTQCKGSWCYCTDRCGHKVPGSDHHIARIREFICACPNNDHAYNCPTNPCEGAVCNAYPDAVCKPSICGGCKADFSVDGTDVDCDEPTGCVDDFGNEYPINAEFEQDCQVCTCTPFGEIFCLDKPCPLPRDDPPSGCEYVVPPGGCNCPTRLACMEPLSNCPEGEPVAMCASNVCLTATCESCPDAICSISFCGRKACQATFYDQDHKELNCADVDKSPKIPSELGDLSTVIPTKPPTTTPTPCPMITCSNACGSAGRRVVNGCRTCKCVDEPSITDCVDEATGKSYKTGEVRQDGCNDCTCMEDGSFACTEHLCGCVDESTGKTYKMGDSYNDGCNDCTCTKTGVFACTKKLCEEKSAIVEV